MAGVKTGISGQINNNIVTDGLVLYIDASYNKSYPRSGTDWYNLENLTISSSLINGASFDNNNQGSIDLDGSDDYIELQMITSSLNLSAGTMDIWFKPHNTSGWKYLISTGNASTTWNVNKYHVAYNHDSQKMGIFNYGSTTDTDDTIANGEVTEDVIHNFVVTNTGKTYLNGVEKSNNLSGTWFDIADEVNHFRIGVLTMNNSIYGSQETNANIYNFKIYNRALSAGEVLQNYQAQKERFGL